MFLLVLEVLIKPPQKAPRASMSRPSDGPEVRLKTVPFVQIVMGRPCCVLETVWQLMSSWNGFCGSSGELRESVGEDVRRVTATTAFRSSGVQ